MCLILRARCPIVIGRSNRRMGRLEVGHMDGRGPALRHGRKDVAVWKLPVDHDLTITGEVIADIFASTTGSDGDFVVKLIDQYPDDDPDPAMRGFQLMTNMEIFRGRYRRGFEKPKAEAG
jgi:predicted acyl esterase